MYVCMYVCICEGDRLSITAIILIYIYLTVVCMCLYIQWKLCIPDTLGIELSVIERCPHSRG